MSNFDGGDSDDDEHVSDKIVEHAHRISHERNHPKKQNSQL